MSFDDYERSRALGQPVELYLFRYGDAPNAYIAYTNAETEITFDGKTYTPQPIDRGAILASGTLDRATLDLKMPKNLSLPELFRIYPPSKVVLATIFQGHAEDPTSFMVVWSGRIINTARAGQEATISCEPIQTTMRRAGLRRNWQHGCPLVLYGPRCKADKARASFDIFLLGVEGTTVILDPEFYDFEIEHFTGGLIEWDGVNGREKRQILQVDGGNFFLAGHTGGLSTGSLVTAVLGCAKNMDFCRGVHLNIQNFGGQPFIPYKNPVSTNAHW